MMNGEVYSDFILLWLLCHESRLEGDKPEECWLEKWSKDAQEEGTKALDQLRFGVKNAIEALGRGFLSHPANSELKEKLKAGTLDRQEYYRQILRLVYRLILLFVAEDRGVLLNPQADSASIERYSRFYSLARIRKLAEKKAGTRHSDLYEGLKLVMNKLGSEAECHELGLYPLGSFLFSKNSVSEIDDCSISNRDLLDAIRALSFITYDHSRRPVDYKHIGSEELGSVYESLLELHPAINAEAGAFSLETAGGHERKTTGSYYTPSSLVQCLLDSALAPVLDEAAKKDNPEEAILNLKVCDPACGSGHFLVAASHRIAKRLAAIRTGDDEPSPESVRKALRDVVGRCIYGVDLNPMAVELCKVSLWMEGIEPGKPLSFLDHHIKCGNSLLGTTPKLIAEGIPDEAFTPIQGDDKTFTAALKKRNKQERPPKKGLGQSTFFSIFWKDIGRPELSKSLTDLNTMNDDSIAALREKETVYSKISNSSDYQRIKFVADAWCAAFVWKKTKSAPPTITHDIFRRIYGKQDFSQIEIGEVNRLAEQYSFFHWHIGFPGVFRVNEIKNDNPKGWVGGFDLVLGNPPWETLEFKEKEWFAESRPDISNAPNAASRRRLIESLQEEDPTLWSSFLEDLRKGEGESHLVRSSGRFPLTARGKINTYAIFAETNRLIVAATGRVGCILPSGIATDDTTKFFFQDLIDSKSLVSLYDFENRSGLFPAIDSRMKFCLLTTTGPRNSTYTGAEFAFFSHTVEDLKNPEKRFSLTPDEIALLSPNTKTCPVFRSKRDAELTKNIYKRYPVLITDGNNSGNPWGITFKQGLFNMASASSIFRTRAQLESAGWMQNGNLFRKGEDDYSPLYEAKMAGSFDHRAADVVISETAMTRQGQADILGVDEHSDPFRLPNPRYWVSTREIEERIPTYWEYKWLLGWRDITSPTNERTTIAHVLPKSACGDTILLLFPDNSYGIRNSLLISCFCSFIFDYLARQKLGGIHLKYHVFKQIPTIPPNSYDQECLWDQSTLNLHWILPRTVELTYTAWDLEAFAQDCGYDGPPFRWDEDRRFLLRCELDAAYFHLYGIERDDVDYIMETFPIVKRKDEQQYGEYRTKRVILEIYDSMAEAIKSGKPYQTRLDPPPADPSLAHPPRTVSKR